MHYVGVAVDASQCEVRIALIDENALGDAPEFRILSYVGGPSLPASLRALHAAVLSMLEEVPARALAVRRQDHSDKGVALRDATIDRFCAEGAVLAAARERVNDVHHLSGAQAGSRLSMDKKQALEETKALLKHHGQLAKWAEATMVARSLT